MTNFNKIFSVLAVAFTLALVAQLQQSVDSNNTAHAHTVQTVAPLALISNAYMPVSSNIAPKVTTLDTVIITESVKANHTVSAKPEHKKCSDYGMYNHGIIDEYNVVNNVVRICE